MIILREYSDKAEEQFKSVLRIKDKIDLQWWLFRSILCMQPLGKEYYNKWYNIYTDFRNVFDNLLDEVISYNDALQQLTVVLRDLNQLYLKLEPVLRPNDYQSLETIVNKLTDGINDISEELKSKFEGEY